jgi:hypothetical protein
MVFFLNNCLKNKLSKMNNYKVEYNFNSEGLNYVFYISSDENSLDIILERIDDIKYWKGNFESKYIEEMSSKAGSHKSFPIFIKMLFTGFSKQSDGVKIDLIGANNIEQMRSNRNDNLNTSNLSNTTVSDFAKSQKKYLIISYSSEFEKVNFPLPLSFITNPPTEIVKRTIDRLRKINENQPNESKNNNYINYKEYEEVKQENTELKNKVRFLESNRKCGAVDNDELIRTFGTIHERYQNYKAESEKGIQLLTKTIEDLRTRIKEGESKKSNNYMGKHDNDINQKKIKDLEDQVDKINALILKEKEQFSIIVRNNGNNEEKMMNEIINLREVDKKMRMTVQHLEKELDEVNKKYHIAFYGDLRKHKNIVSTPKSNYSHKTSSVKSNYSYNSKKSVNSNISKKSKLSNFSQKSNNSKKSNVSKNSNVSKKSNASKQSYTSKASNISKKSNISKNSVNSKASNNSKNVGKTLSKTSKKKIQVLSGLKVNNNNKTSKQNTKNIDINDRLKKIQNLLNIAKIK